MSNEGVIEKTISFSDLAKSLNLPSTSNDSAADKDRQQLESTCQLLLQQVLKSYPRASNLSSITIKTTSVPTVANVDINAETKINQLDIVPASKISQFEQVNDLFEILI